MSSNYCRECGTKLVPKELEHEGIVPYCPTCGTYRFPQYNVAVIMIVVNEEKQEILLMRQDKKLLLFTRNGSASIGTATQKKHM